MRLDLSWRRIGPRVASGLLVSAAILCLGLNRADPELVERLQTGASEVTSPAFLFLSRPLQSLHDWLDSIGQWRAVYQQNQDLRQNNQRLLAWQDTALRLEAENAALRAELHVAPDPAISEITTRVIGDPAGGFVQSILLAAGTSAGIEKGQPAVAAASISGQPALGALVGRVVQAGDSSSRLLLLTDVNSRVPVVLDQSHVHAILGGDNSDRPQLMLLPAGVSIAVGERVVTSGNDRRLPPGIAVGVVVSNDENGVRVAPMADLSRLEFVSVLKYQGVSPLPAPETPQPPAGKVRHRS